MLVCKIGKPRGIIITTKGNHPKCLERKCFRNFLFLELTLMGIFKSRKVVGGEIFCSFFITDNDIKFLEQQNLPEQSWLSILLTKRYLRANGRIHYALDKDTDMAGISRSIHYGKTAPTAKSLASHMISNGKSQSGAQIEIGAWETPLRVVIAFTSPFGLAMVLLGREPEPEVEAVLLFMNLVIRSGKLWELVFLSRIKALTISFSSATSDETAGVEELVFTLETMALLRD
ncbi:hypothetical protein Tco_0824223 [Tanacetum coccineum]|uniref:Uncharacterized protein n=1 Tax=Tanacetum coccineum TaxID=301880 RepID=A0ABQ5AQ58_9ASTR